MADLRLNEEVRAFYNFMTPTEAEYAIRKTLIETITCAVLRWDRDLEVIPFGSWQTQMYLPAGDLDLVVTKDGPELSVTKRRKFLYELAAVCKMAGLTDKVAVIANAKVPIVKFVTKPAYGEFADTVQS